MNFTKIIPLSFIAAILLMNSCASKLYFTSLDVMKPAEITFPANVNNVVIVNNSVIQPSNIGHYNTTLYGNKTSETLAFDSAAIFITSALRDGLKQNSFFHSVDLSLVNQNSSNIYNTRNKFTFDKVKTLCKTFNADAIIALNNVNTTDNISEYYTEEGIFINELDVKIKTDWSIYYLDKTANTIQFVDSFLWQNEDYSRDKSRKELPSRYNALVDANILTGTNTATRMIPRWEKEERYFFTSRNKIMKQAMDSVQYRKWEKAIELWKTAAENSNSNKTKYQSFNNIANGYEILGNMDTAIQYAKKSLDTLANMSISSDKDAYILINNYKNLVKRREEMKILKQQIGN